MSWSFAALFPRRWRLGYKRGEPAGSGAPDVKAAETCLAARGRWVCYLTMPADWGGGIECELERGGRFGAAVVLVVAVPFAGIDCKSRAVGIGKSSLRLGYYRVL